MTYLYGIRQTVKQKYLIVSGKLSDLIGSVSPRRIGGAVTTVYRKVRGRQQSSSAPASGGTVGTSKGEDDMSKIPVEQYRLQLFRDKRGHARMRLIAQNGRIIMSSEDYASKRSMMRTVNKLRRFMYVEDLL